MLIVWGEFIWAHYNHFTGVLFFSSWIATCYSVVWSSIPIIWLLLFDNDLPRGVKYNDCPEIYTMGPDHYYYNRYQVLIWMIIAGCQGVAAWFAPWYLLVYYESDGPQSYQAMDAGSSYCKLFQFYGYFDYLCPPGTPNPEPEDVDLTQFNQLNTNLLTNANVTTTGDFIDHTTSHDFLDHAAMSTTDFLSNHLLDSGHKVFRGAAHAMSNPHQVISRVLSTDPINSFDLSVSDNYDQSDITWSDNMMDTSLSQPTFSNNAMYQASPLNHHHGGLSSFAEIAQTPAPQVDTLQTQWEKQAFLPVGLPDKTLFWLAAATTTVALTVLVTLRLAVIAVNRRNVLFWSTLLLSFALLIFFQFMLTEIHGIAYFFSSLMIYGTAVEMWTNWKCIVC